MKKSRTLVSSVHWIRRSILILLLFLVVPFSIYMSAQISDRGKLLREIITLKRQAESTSDPEERKKLIEGLDQKVRLFLGPSAEDREAFSSLLKQPDTGITRLLHGKRFNVIVSAGRRLGFSDVLFSRGGWVYSFARQDHFNNGPDLGFDKGTLGVSFAGADFGFLTKLGDIPIESVTVDTPGVAWLSTFTPPLDEPGARKQYRRSYDGFKKNGVRYKRSLPLEIGMTYVLRSVNYGQSDILVVFRTHRLDTDMSLILPWKMLKRYATPQLNG